MKQMASKGYFIITDISGYTEYLTRSELDHAHEILQSLFDAQIAAIKHPFLISGFRGDAIFMYAPETNFVQAQSFIEALENFYMVFKDTLQQMQYNTTCTCRACKNMGLLDLKMCIHYGEYLVQKLADREELLGADVIVPHRMLKNHVIEKTQVTSYALFSDTASQALHLMEFCPEAKQHSETYEHIGEVPMWVHDLQPVWDTIKARRRIFVSAEEAWVKFETDLPFPPGLIWEYLTTPKLEAGFMGYDYAERTDALGGRMREDAEFHCAHGELNIYNKILDWNPCEYYTIDQSVPLASVVYHQTRRLIPTKNGTRVAIYMSKPLEGASMEVQQLLQEKVDEAYRGLGAFIEKDLANGRDMTSP
jgi:uncharacterized protein YndB with AHSA1/START domain